MHQACHLICYHDVVLLIRYPSVHLKLKYFKVHLIFINTGCSLSVSVGCVWFGFHHSQDFIRPRSIYMLGACIELFHITPQSGIEGVSRVGFYLFFGAAAYFQGRFRLKQLDFHHVFFSIKLILFKKKILNGNRNIFGSQKFVLSTYNQGFGI